jgi:hypothetical protein
VFILDFSLELEQEETDYQQTTVNPTVMAPDVVM